MVWYNFVQYIEVSLILVAGSHQSNLSTTGKNHPRFRWSYGQSFQGASILKKYLYEEGSLKNESFTVKTWPQRIIPHSKCIMEVNLWSSKSELIEDQKRFNLLAENYSQYNLFLCSLLPQMNVLAATNWLSQIFLRKSETLSSSGGSWDLLAAFFSCQRMLWTHTWVVRSSFSPCKLCCGRHCKQIVDGTSTLHHLQPVASATRMLHDHSSSSGPLGVEWTASNHHQM